MDALAAPAGNEPERIARLEERMALVQALLEEIRRDQRDMGEIIARASGGMKVLLLLGALAGLAGTLRGLANWAAGLVEHSH